MKSKIRAEWLVDRVVIPAFIVFTFVRAALEFKSRAYSVMGVMNGFVLPVIVLTLFLIARPAKASRFNFNTALGLIFSFGGFLLFRWTGEVPSKPVAVLWVANTIFYLGLVTVSYFKLGRSFGVVPSLRQVVVAGPYKLVRHPIYAGFLHVAFNIAILSPSLRNIFAALIIFAGLVLRVREEEQVLAVDPSYVAYMQQTRRRFFELTLSMPLVIVALGMTGQKYFVEKQSDASRGTVLQIAFPISSLNPLIYDDWSSVFVGNHIYRRLFPEPDRPGVLAVTDRVNISEGGEIRFEVKPFQDCMGRSFTAGDIRAEFENILETKTWILPGWKRCESRSKNEICVSAPKVTDIKRRMRNLYFRFGWSKVGDKDTSIGTGPYCLTGIKNAGTNIIEGEFKPISTASGLEKISFITSESPVNKFNIALYGTNELVTGNRINVQTLTPLAYYVVTSERYGGYRLPWNTKDSRDIMWRHLSEAEVFYPTETKLEEVLPQGGALERSQKPYKGTRTLEFALPDYLPKCSVLADKLTARWKELKQNAVAKCANTSLLIENVTKRGLTDWFGMMSPLSPGAPGRGAIEYQYFSPYSKESWTGKAHDASALYYMLGVGQSLATVDNERYCGLRPNSMGLGDVFITDFIRCAR